MKVSIPTKKFINIVKYPLFMKIMICGSMTFAKEMIEAKEKLEKLGYNVKIPIDAHDIVNGKHDSNDLKANFKYCLENDIMRLHFKFIEESDAILILNYDKSDIKGYMGTSSLMELALAYHLSKKMFLLYPVPDHSNHRWAHEVMIMQPIILDGDLSKIKEFI
jgi:hypothetical protein